MYFHIGFYSTKPCGFFLNLILLILVFPHYADSDHSHGSVQGFGGRGWKLWSTYCHVCWLCCIVLMKGFYRIFIFLYFWKIFACIYLAVLGLGCSTWDLRSSLRHVDLCFQHSYSQLWHVGSSSQIRDQTQVPLSWEHRVLATGPPRSSFLHFSQ